MSVTSEIDPVDALVDIFEDASSWTHDKPEIYRHHDVAVSDRENNANDAIYVANVIDIDLSRFAIEPDSEDDRTEDSTPQVLVYSLDETRAKDIARDIVDILKGYQSDNYSKTAFHSIEPDSLTDNRAAKVVRQTSHYIYLVEIEMHRKG